MCPWVPGKTFPGRHLWTRDLAAGYWSRSSAGTNLANLHPLVGHRGQAAPALNHQWPRHRAK